MDTPVRRIPFTAADHDGDRVCVQPCCDTEPVWIDSWTADAIGRLRGSRTIEQHVEDLCARIDYDPADLGDELAAARDAGLLLDRAQITAIARGAADREPAQVVDTLVVVACGKPALAARALRTFASASHPRHVYVVDDSGPDDRPAMIAALVETGVDAMYLGERQKRALAKQLVERSGADTAAAIELALHGTPGCGRTAGANRNAAFLAAAGTRFVSVDDDTLAPLASPGGSDGAEARLTGAFDPTELAFYADARAALDLTPAADHVLAAHGRVLGRPTGCLDAAIADDLGDADLADLLSGRGRVRASMTGIAGDVAMATTHSYMFLHGLSRERLMADYEDLRLTRATRRAVRGTAIGRPGFFMTTCAGFDNRAPLPPMFPFDRFQDHLFAASLRKAQRDAYVGWLPELVRHEPAARPRKGRASLFSPTEGIHTALHVMMATNASDASTLADLGEDIERLGDAPHREYRAFIEDKHAAAVTRRLEHVDRLLARYDETPAAWAADLEECAERWERLLESDDPSVPGDLTAAGHSPAEAWRICQSAVREYGSLLQRWEAIFDAARELEEAGEPLTFATP